MVTQLALHDKILGLHEFIFLWRYKLVLSSALDCPQLLNLRLGETVFIEGAALALLGVLGVQRF